MKDVTMTEKQLIVTKESLQSLIDNKLATGETEYVKQLVGRALVILFDNQTVHEQRANTVNVHNEKGFTGADGYGGSMTAKFYLKHRTLADWQLNKWLKKNKNGWYRITKYHRQLNEAAIKKLEKEKIDG